MNGWRGSEQAFNEFAGNIALLHVRAREIISENCLACSSDWKMGYGGK